MFLILLAALGNVDRSQIEAAEIDGAGYWRIFFKIVLRAIWPVMAVALLIRGLDLVRVFDIIWSLTTGRPGHDDGDHLGLRLSSGLRSVRDQLHRRPSRF